MRYFLDNQDDVWAIDEKGNEFLVTKEKYIPVRKGSIDLMWGGISETQIKQFLR